MKAKCSSSDSVEFSVFNATRLVEIHYLFHWRSLVLRRPNSNMNGDLNDRFFEEFDCATHGN